MYFKNYFVTGDYVVGGVGLRGRGVNGIATATIDMGPNAVPPGADVLAALLYWQEVTTDTQAGLAGASFKGNPLSSVEGSLAKVISPEGGTAPCWSSGGGTGSSGGLKRTYTYRADVLRFLEVGPDGKFIVSGQHAVQLPDAGSGGNSVPLALGASLLVIYRDPNPSTPLNSIVIYDGGFTMDQSNESLTQTIRGFYQVEAGTGGQVADKMTHIVGSGQANKSERLLFNGLPTVPSAPFVGHEGESWDNFTFSPTNLASSFAFDTEGGQYATTTVDHVGFSSFDCLTWGAIVYRTAVLDSDKDGLLDLWESSTGPLHDPGGAQLPSLAAMGANPAQQDLFVEIGYLYSNSALSYGGAIKPAHSHLPDADALKMVAESANEQGIKVHFDIGSNYQTDLPSIESCQATWNWRCAIIPAGLARGGEAINELVTVCAPDATKPWVCQFAAYPGTVGWKTGFRFLRDALVNDAADGPALAVEGVCPPGTACRPRFDGDRKDIFHYALFAHAVGLPKSKDPLSLDFHVPRTNTGVADLPGGDLMVTLGGFDDISGRPVGTPFMQASTLLHELGHNFWRRHGGDAGQPNCKPNYLSVMNYLFQLRGLLDASGVAHVDLSSQTLAPSLSESSLGTLGFDETSAGPKYRTAWYAKQGPGTFGPAATTHCDGSANTDGATMVRVDALGVNGAIDWNPNPTPDDPSQDVNFDGDLNDGTATAGHGPMLAGSDDWVVLRLNQVGSRRNVGAPYVRITSPCSAAMPCLAVGPLSLDLGQGDLGQGDLGQGDLGQGDLGQGDLGQGDLGQGDLGGSVLGQGDLGQGDLGQGDLGVGAPGEPVGELDFGIALALGRTPPNEVRACVIGTDPGCPAAAPASPLHRVRVDWKAPHAGTALQYFTYRVFGDPQVAPFSLSTAVLVGLPVAAVTGQPNYSMIDLTELPDGQSFTYFVVAEFTDGPDADVANDLSAPSILATIVAVNSAPVAVAEGFSVSAGSVLTIPASGVLMNDTDVDSPPTSLNAALVTAPLHGTLILNGNGGFTYQPVSGYSGPDSFSYKANDGTFSFFGSNGTPMTVPMSPDSNTVLVTITVTSTGYAFVGIQNAPPTGNKPFKAGSAVPMKWQYANGSTVVDSSLARFTVTVTGPIPNGPVRNITNTDPGSSSFRYDVSTKTWQFNLQTKEANGSNYVPGTYNVQVIATPSVYLPSPVFQIQLGK